MDDSPSNWQIAGCIPKQTAHSVLMMAMKRAESLFQTWCRSPGNGNEFDKALEILQQAVKAADAALGKYSENAIGLLLAQGGYRQTRLFRQGRRVDADEGALVYQDVLERDPNNFKGILWLSWIRRYQYDKTGQRSMLDHAVDLLNDAFFLSLESNNDLADVIIFVALSLKDRAEADGSADDLDVMIELLRFGLNLQGLIADGPILLRLLLVEGLALRYSVSGKDIDISEAESLLEASNELPVSIQHSVYQNLVKGVVSQVRFDQLRQTKDSITNFQSYENARAGAIRNSACPSQIKSFATMKLAQSLRESYHWGHKHMLIYGAYNFAKLAMNEAKVYSQDWCSSFSLIDFHWTLGEVQRSRYNIYNSTDILDESVAHFRECARLTSFEDARFGRRAAELSGILRLRFKSWHTSSFQTLLDRHEAIYWIGKLLQARQPLKPTEKQICLLEIGDLLQDLVVGPTTTHVLDQAMCHYSLADTFGNLSFSSSVGSWRRMAQALVDKGRLTNQLTYYESAEQFLEQVEALCKQTKCWATGHMPLLARLYEEKYWLTHSVKDATRAVEANYSIFHNSSYEFVVKSRAARRFLIFTFKVQVSKNDPRLNELFQTLEKSTSISLKSDDAVRYTIDFMSQRISDALNRNQQLLAIRQEASMPLICLWASKVARKSAFDMLSLYERVRSILWDRLLNSKTQIDLLEAKHADLAQSYQKFRKLLESSSEADPNFTDLPVDKYECAAKLDDVIKEIHKKPGFEDFLLLPLSREEIQNYAGRDFIVYVISGPLTASGLALTVKSDSISIVDLPGYSANRCQEHYDQLKHVCANREGSPSEMDIILGEVLKWLWYSAAKPVLQALKLLQKPPLEVPSRSLPRLWWITSDWIGRLPVHAAGDLKLRAEQGAPSTVMDNVVSSYTPTLRALQYSRSRLDQVRRAASANSSLTRAMLVAMQKTPDRPELAKAVPEIERVQATLEPEMLSTTLVSHVATRKTVVKNLRHCTIAHLACHGEADPHDPLRSKLMLQDWNFKPLRVGFLMRMEMSNCQLAYLSACQTAVSEDGLLVEEGLHLSGAFQMAGVPNTIATSWEILDEEAADVAASFYEGMRDENGKIDIRRSARSLHAAIMGLRDSGSSPYIWGSYVHFGA